MAVPTSITDLSVTAASNSPAGTDTVASTTGPDDYLRALAAIIKEACATVYTAIGADTITFSTTPTFSAYAAGMRFHFIAAGANTGAVTLNINSLGAKAVTREGTTALAAGDIASGAVVCVEYDGTRFQITSGRSVQPLDALLTALAAQTTAANQLQGYSGSDVAALFNIGAATGYIPLWDHIPLNSRVTKTAAYSVVVSDRGKLIDATTGTWALKFDSVTLGANFVFAVRNSGTGTITLTALNGDPTTALIDGAATLALNAGESCFVFCDGTNFETVGHAVALPLATASNNGQMSSAYAAKLDGIAAGATVGVPVDAGVVGVGCFAYATVLSSGSVANGGTIAGSSLQIRGITDAGALYASYSSPPGTWRNISGALIGYSGGVDYTGLVQRVA